MDTEIELVESEWLAAGILDRARGDDGRTHYDRLLERRRIHQLEALLAERLAPLGTSRDLDVESRAVSTSAATRCRR